MLGGKGSKERNKKEKDKGKEKGKTMSTFTLPSR